MIQETPIHINQADTNMEEISVSDNILLLQDIEFYKDSSSNTLRINFYSFPSLDSLYGEEKSFLIQVPSKPFEDQSHLPYGFDWFFGISLLFFSLLALIRLNYFKAFTLSYRVLVSGKSNVNVYSNELSNTRFSFLPFILSTCIVFSLGLYIFPYQLSKDDSDMFLLISFIIIVAFLLFRFLLLKLVGLLFNIGNVISESEYFTGMLHFVSAVLCFPFIFISYYYPFSFFLISIIIIFIIVFLVRIIRSWMIFRKKLRIYEYFLYLCTIEILPLLVLLKFVANRLLVF